MSADACDYASEFTLYGDDKEITKHFRLRPENCVSRGKKPEKLKFDLATSPNSIEAVMLRMIIGCKFIQLQR